MIKESFKLTEPEAQLATGNLKWYSQMLLFFDDYLQAKNLTGCLISSRDIDDQTILQNDWPRGSKVITKELNFPWTKGFSRIMKLFCKTHQSINFLEKAKKNILDEFFILNPALSIFGP